jgi:NAD(P)-dependent dehydrogenase (short-subunit alcohol dehydrogenase family)
MEINEPDHSAADTGGLTRDIPMGKLAGRVALITGAGSGIGSATARRFAREGARVFLVDVDEARVSAVSAEIGEAADWKAGDHCRGDDNRRVIDAALERFGALHILYNNAGVAEPGGVSDIDADVFKRVLAVNLVGPFLLTQAALPALKESAAREGASILFTASAQAIMVRPGFAAYGASKHGLAGFIGSVALELAPTGIRVNGICPGPIDTPLLRKLAVASGDEEEFMTRFRTGIPMQRLPELDDVAAAAVFLSSDEARMITGIMLPVDGGLTAR